MEEGVHNVDRLLSRLAAAYKRVSDAQGRSVALPSAELELLSILGQLRDAFLKSLYGDREVLMELFGGTCHRVAYVRAIVNSVVLSAMTASDQRLRGCIGACASVEQVLVDMGLGEALHAAEEKAKRALQTGGQMDDTESPVHTSFSAKRALQTGG